jgi:phenylalanine-4-hydroxylase
MHGGFAMTISVADYAAECAEQGLRGNYAVCRPDFTVDQAYDYTEAEQAVWRTLCDRQTRLTDQLAHKTYLDGVEGARAARPHPGL